MMLAESSSTNYDTGRAMFEREIQKRNRPDAADLLTPRPAFAPY